MKKYALAYAEKYDIAIIPLHNIVEDVDGSKKCSCYRGKKCGKSSGKHPRFPEWEKKWSKDPKQINEWWDMFPDANIGMVTGKASNGICVVDVDAEIGRNNLKRYVNGTISPVAKTARTDFDGEHWYFRTNENIPDNIKAIKGLDFRNNGLIVLPPSQGLAKRYEWKNRLSEYDIPELPESLRLKLTQSKSRQISDNEEVKGGSLASPQEYIRNVYDYIEAYTLKRLNVKRLNVKGRKERGVVTPNYFCEGQRESDLFSLANALTKVNMDTSFIREVLTRVMFTCHDVDPVFIETKIKNAQKRHKKEEKISFREAFDKYICESSVTDGTFSVNSCYRDMDSVNSCDKANVRQNLKRLKDAGIIERVGTMAGMYRRVERDCNIIDWQNVTDVDYYELHMPMGLGEKLKLHPKGIMVIAGSQNAGKTAFVMRMALMNSQHKVNYFNSEMGDVECRQRIKAFEHVDSDWNHVSFYEKNNNFHDVIKPNDMNIIDFLEINDNFYQVGELIRNIHDRLDKGIAIICLQKKKDQEMGRGAEFGLEKPRIYLSMDFQILKVIKAKSVVNNENMNGKEIPFRLINGTNFIQQEGEC
jgi:hypothetical protein